jgi:small-conductance mechanosensitive channel
MEEVVRRGGYSLNTGRFLGVLVKWFVIIVFLLTALDILGLSDVRYFLGDIVVTYIPNVIVAVLILIVAVIVADAMQKVVVASVKAAHVKSAHLLGSITKWSIWIFAMVAALLHLGIAPSLIETIVTGIVFAAALAIGLAFGLGSKEAAGRIIDRVLHNITEKE